MRYKLVPVEPTEKMLSAGERALEAGCYASGIYADMLAAAPEVEQEPVAWVRMKGSSPVDLYARKKQAELFVGLAGGSLEPLYLHPQPAPDATILVETLESIAEYWNQDSNEGAMRDACEYAQSAALAALTAYRKQGGGPDK